MIAKITSITCEGIKIPVNFTMDLARDRLVVKTMNGPKDFYYGHQAIDLGKALADAGWTITDSQLIPPPLPDPATVKDSVSLGNPKCVLCSIGCHCGYPTEDHRCSH